MNLRRVEGPECRNCGCMDCEAHGRAAKWGDTWQRWRCNNCGEVFSAAPKKPPEPLFASLAQLDAVIFSLVKCRRCKSTRTKITRTLKADDQPRVRYHKCLECGNNFKSVEE